MDNKPHLQSSSAACRHLFLSKDRVVITASVIIFAVFPIKRHPSSLGQCENSLPSSHPLTGHRQLCWGCCNVASGVQKKSLGFQTAMQTVLEGDTGSPDPGGAGNEAPHSWGHKQVKSRQVSRSAQVGTICWASPHQKCALLPYLPNAPYGLRRSVLQALLQQS